MASDHLSLGNKSKISPTGFPEKFTEPFQPSSGNP